MDNLARIHAEAQSVIGKSDPRSDPPNPDERILRFPNTISAAGAGNVKAAIELVNQATTEMRRLEKRAQETEQYAQGIAERAVESLRIADERLQRLEAERNAERKAFESYINQAIAMIRQAAGALTLERTRVGDAEDKLHQLEARIGAVEAIAGESVNAIVRLKDEILAKLSRRDEEPRFDESVAA